MAQENEIPDVLHLIGKLVDAASAAALKLPARIDAAGRDPFPEDDLAKFVLAQQYDGRSNRVAVGLLKTWSREMGIVQNRQHLHYKTLERAYNDADVIALLNEVFFLTQQPVKGQGAQLCTSRHVPPNDDKEELGVFQGGDTTHCAQAAASRRKP